MESRAIANEKAYLPGELNGGTSMETAQELPEACTKAAKVSVRWFAGIQVLLNGNIFVCNSGGKVPFFELSRGKRVVWQTPSAMAVPFGHGIQRLDMDAPALK